MSTYDHIKPYARGSQEAKQNINASLKHEAFMRAWAAWASISPLVKEDYEEWQSAGGGYSPISATILHEILGAYERERSIVLE